MAGSTDPEELLLDIGYRLCNHLPFSSGNPLMNDGCQETPDTMLRIPVEILSMAYLSGFAAGAGHNYKDSIGCLKQLYDMYNDRAIRTYMEEAEKNPVEVPSRGGYRMSLSNSCEVTVYTYWNGKAEVYQNELLVGKRKESGDEE